MVEIRYGEHYEMADLAGKSVAEAREQYKQEFGIPDKAQARLNSKGIGKKHEPRTALSHNDSLTFAQKSRKGLFFIGTILLALAITGSIFAYGATTATVDLLLGGQPDFAGVTADVGPPTWDVFGSYKGRVTAGDLFNISTAAGWTGDMSVILTFTNAHDMVEAYKILVLKIEVHDSLDNVLGGPEYLTLGKGDVEINFSYDADQPLDVEIVDGFYITHKQGWGVAKEDPSIYCQVLQRSAP